MRPASRYAFYALRLLYTPAPVHLSSVGRTLQEEQAPEFESMESDDEGEQVITGRGWDIGAKIV
jgi:hypothetical protein